LSGVVAERPEGERDNELPDNGGILQDGLVLLLGESCVAPIAAPPPATATSATAPAANFRFEFLFIGSPWFALGTSNQGAVKVL